MKQTTEQINYHGDFGMEFLEGSCCGKLKFLIQYSTKLFCKVGQIVYV